MTNKETVARKMGEYLESKDWTVFERSSKCDECDGRCPHDAHFCPKCGVKLVPFFVKRGIMAICIRIDCGDGNRIFHTQIRRSRCGFITA